MRMNDGARRVRTQAVSTRSRTTGRAGRETRDKARVVGILRACMAKFFGLSGHEIDGRFRKNPHLQNKGIHG